MKNLFDKYEENGFVVLENAIPSEIVDKYLRLYENEHGDSVEGWGRDEKYADYQEIRDILCHPTIAKAFDGIEISAALHIEMTMQKSTECCWHKDSLLQDKYAASTYIGAFVCLEDIDADSGPFEVIPGSHKWDHLIPLLTREKVETGQDGEQYMEDLLLAEAEKLGADIFTFLGKKGDVLLWHSQLAHRGAQANGRQRRKTIIGHYCGNYSHEYHHGPLPEFNKWKSEMLSSGAYSQHGDDGTLYFNKVDWSNLSPAQ